MSGYVEGPVVFGRTPTVADAMYAPVVTRFRSYAVEVDPVSAAYCTHICGWPDLVQWVAARAARTGAQTY